MNYFIGVDIGGTNIKAVVLDQHGNTVASSGQRTPLEVPQSGFNERDMDVLWEITSSNIKQAIQSSGIDPSLIAAVGCTGHGKGMYLIGKDGKPAYRGIASTDSRGMAIVDDLIACGIDKEARKLSFQDLYVSQPIILLKWFKANAPEVLENTKYIFAAKDYLRYMLTDQAFAEITDYSGTGMVNNATEQFDPAIFKLFEIEAYMDRLPEIRYSCDMCGNITKKASEQTGIPEGVPVCGGMFDIDACAIAMGANSCSDICVITGTWAINEYVADTTVDAPTIGNTLFCVPGKKLIDASSPASAGNLEWFLEVLGGSSLQKDGHGDYDTINRLVEESNPLTSDIVFLPFLYGTNQEHVRKSCFWGLDNSHTMGDLLRAIYEGVAFCHKNHVDKLIENRTAPEFIRLAGGVANSPVWVQIFADVLGIPIKIIDTNELGGLGCAIAASVAAGFYHSLDEATSQMMHVKKIVYPCEATQKIMEHKYRNYNNLIKALSYYEKLS